MAKRKPGPRSRLPPRRPIASKILWLASLDFANDDVVKLLRQAGWQIDRSHDEAEIATEIPLAGLNASIRELVACKISDRAEDRRYRDVPLEKVRKTVAKLERSVRDLILLIPHESDGDLESIVAGALDCELYELPTEEPLHLTFIRANLEALQEAARRVRMAESGKGTVANRVDLTFVNGLAKLFNDYTGSTPSPMRTGRFGCFVAAVNLMIPDSFRILDAALDHLIAAAAANITT